MRSPGDWNDDAPSTSTSATPPVPPTALSPPPSSSSPQPHLLLRRRRLAGLACVLAVATVWAGASFVVAGVEAAGLPPLALTYIANSLFVLYLPAYCALRARRRRRERRERKGPGFSTGEQPLDDFGSSSGSSGMNGLKLSDAEEASFPLVPRPREGPRGLESGGDSGEGEGGGGGGRGRGGGEALPPPSPSPPAAPPPTPSDAGPRTAPPSAPPLFSPRNSRILAAMEACLSRFLPAATTAAEAEARGGGCGGRCLFYLSEAERSVALAALAVAPLWFGAQLSFNASLARTSVTSNTILSTASSLFTYALAVLLLKEPVTARRGLSVAACVAGVVAVALADSGSSSSSPSSSPPSPSPSPSPSPRSASSSRNRTLAGDALVLLSCTLYAGYTVAVRALLVDEDGGAATMLFFGFVGLINLVFGFPLVALALIPGTKIFSAAGRAAALSPKLVAAAAAKGLLDNLLSDYLWARAVLLVGPTVATVGLNVQVPLAAGLDAAVGKPKPAWTRNAGAAALTAAGALAVVVGVCGIAAAAE